MKNNQRTANPLLAAAGIVALAMAGPGNAQNASAEQSACSQPDLPDRPLQANELNGIMARAQSYLECMKKAIETEQGKASSMLEAARAQAAKSNKMVEDVNLFVRKARDYQAEHQGN
jgi:hypothetical protein